MLPPAQFTPSPPFLSKAPEFLRDFGFPFATRLKSRTLLVGGLPLHSRSSAVTGTTPFVLVHGLVISSLYMIPLAECLAVRGEVHALDLPGFGRSKGGAPRSVVQLSEAVIEWLTAAGIDRCHLVANSLGCQVAAHVASTTPGRVATLTLIGATIDPEARHIGLQVGKLVRDAWREPCRLWANWMVDFIRAGLGRSLRTTSLMFQDHIEEQLPSIVAPTLVVRGANDPTMPQSWAHRATALLPNGRLLVFPGHAHCVHYTAPGAMADAISAHAGRTGLP